MICRLCLLITCITLPIFSSFASDDFSKEVQERFQPNLISHNFSLHAGFVANRSVLGLQLNFSFNEIVAWRGTNSITLSTSNKNENDIQYSFSDLVGSALVFRTPNVFANLLRTYVVSEINLDYDFSTKKIVLAYSWRGGFELFTARDFSVFVEAGVQVPFYRQKGAIIESGGLALLGASFHF